MSIHLTEPDPKHRLRRIVPLGAAELVGTEDEAVAGVALDVEEERLAVVGQEAGAAVMDVAAGAKYAAERRDAGG